MKRNIILLLALILAATSTMAQRTFQKHWKTLEGGRQPVPEWMRDAKFGIYCHWGVYTVPAYGNEQYIHWMYMTGENDRKEIPLMGIRERQEQLYGPLTEFGYHDFIPMFRGEKFNADEWAQLFRESGARFAGLVGEHHDGFSMWNSKFTPWNAAQMGPRRDVVGELEKAIRERGMKFMVSLHHENNYYYACMRPGLAGYDKKYERLYGSLMPRKEWQQMWIDKCLEVVDQYHPDIIYFDAWMDSIPDNLKFRFAKHYLADAAKLNKQVAFTYKNEDFPRTVGMLDHEMFSPDQIDTIPWLCDWTISKGYHQSWGYVKGMQVREPKEIIHKLVEVVANNGQLLLNLSPMSDGTFPQNQKDCMANVGVWLWSYGEAIYDTRPFVVSHETTPEGVNVFYTRKPNSVYVILPEWPGAEKTMTLSALNQANLKGRAIKQATLLSVKKNYDCLFSASADGLKLTIRKGSRMPSDCASVVRLDLE